MAGYTFQFEGSGIEKDGFKILRNIILAVKYPVIAEGNVDLAEKAGRILQPGT